MLQRSLSHKWKIQPVCKVQGYMGDGRCCMCVHRNSSVWGQKACFGGGGRCSPGTINLSVQVSNQISLWQALWDYPRLLRALTASPAGPGKQHCLFNSSRPAFSLARPGGAVKAHGPLLSWPARRAFRGMYGQDGTLVFTEPAEGKRNPRPVAGRLVLQQPAAVRASSCCEADSCCSNRPMEV